MRTIETASKPVDTKTKVTRILSEALGSDTDLRTERDRAEALERLGSRPESDVESAAKADATAFEDIAPDDMRTAWQIARGFCGDVQLKTAVRLLDGLKPLSVRGEAFEDARIQDFDDLKRQIQGEIMTLRDELKGDADAEALKGIFEGLVKSSVMTSGSSANDSLFDQLRVAGNYFNKNVVTRADERVVVDYLTTRGFVAQLCKFPISCDGSAQDPEEAGTSVGRDLAALDGHLHCIGEVSTLIRTEIEALGVKEGCGLSGIPGVEIDPEATSETEGDETATVDAQAAAPGGQSARQPGKQPTYGKQIVSGNETSVIPEPEPEPEPKPKLDDLFSLLRRSVAGSIRWRESLAKNGRDSVAVMGGEVDRLSQQAARFKPRRRGQGDDTGPVLVADLTEQGGSTATELAVVLKEAVVERHEPAKLAIFLEVLIANYKAATNAIQNLRSK